MPRCRGKSNHLRLWFFFFQAEDGIRDADVTGVQTCALPILTKALNGGCKLVLLPVGEARRSFKRLLQRLCHGWGSSVDGTKPCPYNSTPTLGICAERSASAAPVRGRRLQPVVIPLCRVSPWRLRSSLWPHLRPPASVVANRDCQAPKCGR